MLHLKALPAFSFAMLLFLFLGNAHAYYNITFINTTLVLNSNQSARVIETMDIFISNSSVAQYIQSRNAVGTTLSYWQSLLYTKLLTEHIVNNQHSIYGFSFLAGPLLSSYNGGTALLTMDYYVNNVTTANIIAPRSFKYVFNDSVFNFEHTTGGPNGQTLPNNARLTIIIPKGARVVSIYPQPDSPSPNFVGNYTDVTAFSWDTGEPLSQFSFSYITTQSLQQEVLAYFSGIYKGGKSFYINNKVLFYLVAVILIVAAAYVYIRSRQ